LTTSETGEYEVIASKAGFRNETQAINITQVPQEYELNFRGETGLVPDGPDVFYVLECVNHWLYPPNEECGLSVFKILAVVNSWLYPYADANVTLHDGMATSNKSGNYILTTSETGEHRVVASKIGFSDESQTINITELG